MKAFLNSFIPLFVSLDVLGLVPLFLGLTKNNTDFERKKIAGQAVITGFFVALSFMFLGKAVFNFLGITLSDFQIAGGIILFIIAIKDLLGHDESKDLADNNMGIVPIGTPLIAGPAVITTLLLLIDSNGFVPTLWAFFANFAILTFSLVYSKYIVKIVGKTGLMAFSKIVSLLLAAIAVSMVLKGVR